jgi:hypothetical protein
VTRFIKISPPRLMDGSVVIGFRCLADSTNVTFGDGRPELMDRGDGEDACAEQFGEGIENAHGGMEDEGCRADRGQDGGDRHGTASQDW